MLSKIWSMLPSKPVDSRIGNAWFEEVLPQYTDRAQSTNKTIWIVKSVVQSNVVIARKHATNYDFSENKVMLERKLLTQDGVAIRFDKKDRLINGVPSFEKCGFRVGDLYHFEHLGFLGNLESIAYVHIVTDQMVIFKEFKGDYYPKYSYEELEKLKPTLKE